MMKVLKTVVNPETNRKLEKAAEERGMNVSEAIAYIAKNGPASFFALVGGVHHSRR